MLRDTLDDNYHTGWGGKWEGDASRTAVFVFEAPLRTRQGERLQVSVIAHPRANLDLPSRFRILGTDADFPELPATGALRQALLADGNRSADEDAALRQAFEQMAGGNANWREIRRLERRKKTLLDQANVSLVAKAVDKPRTMRVLPRGNWMDDSGEVVEPQVPRFLGTLPTGEGHLTRLDLADWVTDRDNPLTARVFVNRLWRTFFGTGLSKVLDDLGSPRRAAGESGAARLARRGLHGEQLGHSPHCQDDGAVGNLSPLQRADGRTA